MGDQMHKYEELTGWLRARLREGAFPAGERIPSENELAARFSLSRCTVRRAVEVLAAEGLLERRHGSGTYARSVAPGLAAGGVVGVVTTYLDDYIFPAIIGGIDRVLTERGLSITLGITGNKTEKEAQCLRAMLDKHVDGLVLEGTKSALPNPNLDLVSEFLRRGRPVVFINSLYGGLACSHVVMDDVLGGHLAAEHLLARGHRRIGGLFKGDDMQGHGRYLGYYSACRDAGVAVDESRVQFYTTEDVESIFTPDYLPLLRRRFESCTALVCYNDQIAVRLVTALAGVGVGVPADLSIVSFDDSSLAPVASVPLTSVSHAKGALGERAAEILLLSAATGQTVREKLAPVLVERGSVRDV